MATEDDEIYNDTPSNESVRDVRLIRKMFEVGTPKSDNSIHGKPTKLTARGINGIDPKPPAKQHPVPSTPGKKGGTVPAVPSKSTVPPKSPTPSKVVPQPPKINQKSSVASTNHLGTTKTRTSGTVSPVTDKGIRPVPHNGASSVPHNGTGGDKNIFQSILRRNNPSATTTTTTSITSATQPVQALKISSDMIRISEISGDRSTVYPPNGFSEVSPQRQPSKGSTGYCAVSPNRSHPKSPLTGKMSVNLVVSANKKTYRKLPVPTTRTPAPRKKPLPPELPKNFAQKFMADMKMAKKGSVGTRMSTERESELLSYDDIYEDVSEYVNQN